MIAWLLRAAFRPRRPEPCRVTRENVFAGLEQARAEHRLNVELADRRRRTTDLLRRSGAVAPIAPSEGWR